MRKKSLPVKFALNRISTKQFAIDEAAFRKEKEEYNLKTTCGLRAEDINSRIVIAATKFEFVQERKAFIIIEVHCHFLIQKASWERLLAKKNKKLQLPKNFATHLLLLTVGATRGILHAKTENTYFNQFILPTINLTEFVKKDAMLDLSNAES